MTTAILVTAIALYVIGTLSTVANIGKPRKPIQPPTAVVTVVINGLVIAGLVYVLLH